MSWDGVLDLINGAKNGDADAWQALHDMVRPFVLQTAQRTLALGLPKTKAGRRRVTIPRETVEVLIGHRLQINQQRLAAGLGGVKDSDLIFANAAGAWPSPDNLSRDWRRLVLRLDLPQVSFHALRHTHVSVLIRDRHDPVSIARRIGHSSAAFTLKQYSHLFNPDDDGAAASIAAAIGGRRMASPAAS